MKPIIWLAPAMAVLLSSCGTVSSLMEAGKTDYKSVAKQSLPPLEIPPNLSRPTGDDRFSVPNNTASGSATFSAYSADKGGPTRAGSTELLPITGKARIERSGSQRWLVVPAAPEKVWPLVKEFWQESGFLINLEIPEAGVMETDWAENRSKIPQDFLRNQLGRLLDTLYSTGERDKFRTRLERGTQPDITEIYISHRGVIEVVAGNSGGGGDDGGVNKFVWQPRPSDPELESEFLSKLMVRLGMDEGRAREVVTGVEKIERAKLVKAADGAGSLELPESFDRAWRRVGLALDRVGFTVEDRDRSKGYYFVRYVDPGVDAANTAKKEDGILSRLAFWRSSSGDAAKNEQFRVLVKDGKDTSQVQILAKDGSSDRTDIGRRILSLLHDQLK